jgi:thioredoxin reductase (NADPH)
MPGPWKVRVMRDVLIIGAGVAGLTAASYLGRFRRPALIAAGGPSRARWIPESHNIPAFSQGIGGEELLLRLQAHAQRYGAETLHGWVQSISREGAGFAVNLDGQIIYSRYVIIATGVEDQLPPLAGATEALLRSVLRVCPICDGFEAVNKKIAVIGDGVRGEHEAEFLRTYSDQVCYLQVRGSIDHTRRRRLENQGIDFLETEFARLKIKNNSLELEMPEGNAREFDVFYSALGCAPRVELAVKLGALCDDNHALRVNAHQQTTVDGLYAAGDIVRGLNQVVIAAAEAAVAATDIHNRLRLSGC